ncbi:hypothetical protein LTR85_011313 [Meristemomyces frigidus]|nr:hypothetical protein LTR85_011313 [Meristemomyces frigidus]
MAPESVSSVRFKTYTNCTTCHEGPNTYTIDSVYPVNYADFVGPIPVAAYRGQAGCVYGGCETISDASYSPFLSVPGELKSAEAIWNQCALFVDGIWDPPIALQQAGTIAAVTTPVATSATTSATAEPVSTLKSPIASSTSVEVTSQTSSTVAESSGSTPPSATETHASSTESDSTEASESASETSATSSDAGSSSNTGLFASETQTSSTEGVGVSSPVSESSVQTSAASSDAQLSDYSSGSETVSQQSSDTSAESSPAYDATTSKAQPAQGSSQAASSSEDAGGSSLPTTSELASTAAAASVTPAADNPGISAAQTTAVVSLGSNSLTAIVSSGQFTIGSNTVSVGQVTTISGHAISAASSAVVVDGSTYQASAVSPSSSPQNALSVLSAAETASDAGNAGQSSSQGVEALSAGDASGSLASPVSQPVVSVGGTTYTVSQDGTVASIGSQELTANGQTITAYVTGGSTVLAGGGSTVTLSAGDVTILAGQTISAAGSGIVVDDSSTLALSATADPGETQAVFTAGGNSITAIASGESIILEDGSSIFTLSSGAQATFEGQIFSALSSGKDVVVDGTSTIALSQAASQTANGVSEAVITVGSQTFTALASSGDPYVVIEDASSTLTLLDGSAETFDSQTISALPSGQGVAIDGTSTISLTSTPSPSPTSAADEAVITASGYTFSAIRSSGVIVLVDVSTTITLPDGSETPFDGQTVSAGSSGEVVVVDGSITKTPSQHSVTGAVSSTQGVRSGSGSKGSTVGAAGATTSTQSSASPGSSPDGWTWSALAVAGTLWVVARIL